MFYHSPQKYRKKSILFNCQCFIAIQQSLHPLTVYLPYLNTPPPPSRSLVLYVYTESLTMVTYTCKQPHCLSLPGPSPGKPDPCSSSNHEDSSRTKVVRPSLRRHLMASRLRVSHGNGTVGHYTMAISTR